MRVMTSGKSVYCWLSLLALLPACTLWRSADKPVQIHTGFEADTGWLDATLPATLGELNGEPIERTALSAKSWKQLRDLRSQMLQKQYEIVWAGVEHIIDARLLQMEAKRRGMTVESLAKKEVGSQVKPLPEKKLRRYYNQFPVLQQLSFERAKPILQQTLRAQRYQLQQRKYVASLRQDQTIAYYLDVAPMPRYAIKAKDEPGFGPSDAPVVVVLFADYISSHCAQARRTLYRIREKYPQGVRVVVKNFPLQTHQRSMLAAKAGYCVWDQDQFVAFFDAIFQKSDALTHESLRQFVQDLGLNMKSFQTCMASKPAAAAVTRDIEQAKTLGLRGAPVFFINGMRLQGWN